MSQVELWAQISLIAINYIIVSTISSMNQKQTVTDLKQDLRTTKEDILAELKDTRENLMLQLEMATKAEIDTMKTLHEAERSSKNGN